MSAKHSLTLQNALGGESYARTYIWNQQLTKRNQNQSEDIPTAGSCLE